MHSKREVLVVGFKRKRSEFSCRGSGSGYAKPRSRVRSDFSHFGIDFIPERYLSMNSKYYSVLLTLIVFVDPGLQYLHRNYTTTLHNYICLIITIVLQTPYVARDTTSYRPTSFSSSTSAMVVGSMYSVRCAKSILSCPRSNPYCLQAPLRGIRSIANGRIDTVLGSAVGVIDDVAVGSHLAMRSRQSALSAPLRSSGWHGPRFRKRRAQEHVAGHMTLRERAPIALTPGREVNNDERSPTYLSSCRPICSWGKIPPNRIRRR